MPTEMHGDATPKIFENARELRNSLTTAEKYLWSKIQKRQLKGFRFRRQHPISLYIADFYCHEAKLVIELDGEYHNTSDMQELDAYRTEVIKNFGIHVLRFTNDDVLNDIETVLNKISVCLPLSLNPSPLKGRGK